LFRQTAADKVIFPLVVEVLRPCSNELHALSFRLTLSLEEKELSLRTLEEDNLAQHNEVSQLLSAIHQAQQLHSDHRREIQELNNQVTYALASSSPGSQKTTCSF